MGFQGFSSRKVKSRGPEDAKILIVGEFPGEKEDERLQAFVGPAAYELDRMLSEAHFVASACRFTNVIRYRPFNNDVELAFASSAKAAEAVGAPFINGRYCLPVAQEGLEDLRLEIESVRPKLIIALGGTALWATTGKQGIEDWRSSQLDCALVPGIPVLPTYHPSLILRAWENRYLAVHDLKRASRIFQTGLVPPPPWKFQLRPSFETVMQCLDVCEAAGTLAVDIETKKLHIVCVGIAWNRHEAICIPFVNRFGEPYWSEEEEIAIVLRLQHILTTHKIIGQNFHYDAQYFARRMMVIPGCHFDTMLAQHVLFPGTPKSLAHNSSLYCPYHVFWKDDGKEWNPKLHSEEQLWNYNCVDCVKTFEVMESQQALITKYGLQEQMDFMMRLWPHVLLTMLRGVAIDEPGKKQASYELGLAIQERQEWLNAVIGRPFNENSPPQMQFFFGEEMGVKLRKGKKTKGLSTDKKALAKIKEDHVLLWPIVQVIEEKRSLQVFKRTFAEASLDTDGRMRCSYNMGGTETFRFSSSENAFYSGTNLQNIPSGNRSTTMTMPNMRKLFLPDRDEEMEIAEVDLAGADAQVVAWEANDEKLKAAFRAGIKIHTVNAKDLFGGNAGPDGKREPYYTMAKQGVHATNYLCQPGTLAKTLNITVHEAEKFQTRWFQIHPGIKEWHRSIEASINTSKSVRNKFGFRRVYFERPDGIMAQAVAWIPQSTVAIVINWAFIRLGENSVPVDVLLQVHDSLVFQYPSRLRDSVLRAVHPLLLTPVPYPDPLTIQLGLKTSSKSWGDCEDCKWPTAA